MSEKQGWLRSVGKEGWSWRAVLDVASSIALMVAAIFVVWSLLRVQAPRAEPSPTIEPPSGPITIDGFASMGRKESPVVLMEFSDFQCQYCSMFTRDVLPLIKTEYIEQGKVRLLFRHLPLPMHARARQAAEASECAGVQGRFWPMHDLLFANPTQLDDRDLGHYARAVGADVASFEWCLAKSETGERVKQDGEFARKHKLTGTPAFLVGVSRGQTEVEVRAVMVGARPFPEFKAHFEKLLQG